MPSTVIRSFEYDDARNELIVTFRSGKVYVYTLVPPSVADAMRSAFSKGVYFNENVRDKYHYRQTQDDVVRVKSEARSLFKALKASKDE